MRRRGLPLRTLVLIRAYSEPRGTDVYWRCLIGIMDEHPEAWDWPESRTHLSATRGTEAS